jgi:cysteine sulfinate desulfinase/cysteine desulfurase-like protein
MDLRTAPEPCQQAVTEVLARLLDQVTHLDTHANGRVDMAAVRRLIRSAS